VKLAWLVLLVPAVASADDWYVAPSAALGVEHFHYAERNSAMIYDEHLGFVPTARLAVDAASAHVFARASFRWTSSSVEYYGAVEDLDTGSMMPLQGPSTGFMLDIDALAGWRTHVANAVTLGGFAGAGQHLWERDLRPLPTGYLEDYSWWYVQAGARADVNVTPRLGMAAELAVRFPFAADLSVTHQPGGFDDADFDLDMGRGLRVGIEAAYVLAPALWLTAALAYDADTIAGSNNLPLTMMGKPVNDASGQPLFITEPYSNTYRETLEVGLRYWF
jgi:hypothetical protein